MSEPFAGAATFVGRVVQNAGRPLVLSAEKSRFSANIYDEYKDFVRDGMFLVAEAPIDGARTICRVRRLESYGDQSSIAFQSIHEFVTIAELEPLGQLMGSSPVPMVNTNLHGFSLRPCRGMELALVFRLPQAGVPLGQVVLDGGEEPVSFLLPEELAYRSAFFCGAKGSGKTTSLRTLLPQLSALPFGRRPAIVILDVEGEFTTARVRELFQAEGVTPKLLKLAADGKEATATLGLAQVHYEDFVNFAPNLPLNSMIHLEGIMKELTYAYTQGGRKPKASEILSEVQRAAWRRPAIHPSQRDALVRATTSDVFAMFDQGELPTVTPADLVREGEVSVLDVSRLTDDQQRVVALYLLSSITRYKDRSQDTTGVLVIMDEAQKLFPHKGDLKQEYAERLGKFVSHIVHRGRRRRLGVILATQYPADVSREVVDLCDTKLVFRMSGSQSWLKATLGDTDAVRKVPELGVGQAYVTSTGLDLIAPVRVGFPQPADNQPAVSSSPTERASGASREPATS